MRIYCLGSVPNPSIPIHGPQPFNLVQEAGVVCDSVPQLAPEMTVKKGEFPATQESPSKQPTRGPPAGPRCYAHVRRLGVVLMLVVMVMLAATLYLTEQKVSANGMNLVV